MGLKSKLRATGANLPSMGFTSWSRCMAAALPACLAIIPAHPASAQSAPQQVASAQPPAPGTSSIESVVVTAERRSINIQKTPLAITSVSGATLDKSFVNLVSDLNATVPSLELTKASGFENLVTIRGVGSETPENSLTTSPGVSEFIDGVYIANSISLDQTLFDVDHIEVLRGPQGALYGTSSDGGVINIVTKQPELGVYGGQADFSAGTYNLFRERAEVNIPIGDTIAIRISAQKYDHDGFGTDTILPSNDLDDAHDQSVKAAILWKPVPEFSATLTTQFYGADQNGAEQKNIQDPQSDPRKFEQDYPAEFNLHTQLYHLNLQYDLDWFSIKSVSGYQGLNHQQQEDSSRGAISYLDYYDDVAGWNTKMKNFNEEFDLVSKPGTSFDWVVGALAINQSSHQFVAEFETPSPPTTTCLVPTPSCLAILPNIETDPPSNLTYGNDSSVTRHSYAAFAQASYHITPDLTFTAGGRFNADNYSQRSINFSNQGVNTQRVQASDRVPTFKGDLDYNITADNLVYASISRGYKPGGTNGIDNSEYGSLKVPVQNTFEAETNTAFEIGSKNFFMDHALRLNLAAYYYFYRNMQFIGDNPAEFNSGMTNIPSIHAYGVEAETSYVALQDRLRVNGSIALENSEVEGNYFAINSTTLGALINNPPLTSPCAFDGTFYNPGCWKLAIASEENLKGKTAPAMPKISGAADISYTFDVPYGTLTPRAQFVFRGAEWERIFNEPAIDRINSYGQINLNLLYVPTGTRWTVQLAATNVTNVNGINSKYTDPYGSFQTSVEYIAPLQVIGTVAYKF